MPCSYCQFGKVVCAVCGAAGKYRPVPGQSKVVCYKCDGSGRVPCPVCKGDWLTYRASGATLAAKLPLRATDKQPSPRAPLQKTRHPVAEPPSAIESFDITLSVLIGLAVCAWLATGVNSWNLAWYWIAGISVLTLWAVAKILQGAQRTLLTTLRLVLIVGCVVVGIWLAIRIFTQ